MLKSSGGYFTYVKKEETLNNELKASFRLLFNNFSVLRKSDILVLDAILKPFGEGFYRKNIDKYMKHSR